MNIIVMLKLCYGQKIVLVTLPFFPQTIRDIGLVSS